MAFAASATAGIITNVEQNAMIRPDDSITGGLVGGLTDVSEARFVMLESTGRMTVGARR